MTPTTPEPFESSLDLPTTSFSDLLRDAQALLAGLKARGLIKGAGSRIETYVNVLEDVVLFRDRRRLRKGLLGLHHASYELFQLTTIWSIFCEDAVLPTRVKELVSGMYAAFQKVKDDDPARAAQFELYLAAALRRGGRRVNVDVEPDIVVELDGSEVAIAAKRPQSLTAVRKALKSGARQIRQAGRPGLIALDLSMAALVQPVALASVERKEDVVRLGITMLAHAIRSVQGQVRHFFLTTTEPEPVGIVYHWSSPVEVRSTDQIANGTRWEVHGPAPSHLLAQALVKGMDTRADSTRQTSSSK